MPQSLTGVTADEMAAMYGNYNYSDCPLEQVQS